MTIPYIIVGLIVLVLLWLIMTYNGLIQKKNQVHEGWSDIDVQLKRRYDLIPNLVQAVKGYMGHEEGVLTKVTEARNMAMKADSAGAKSDAENALSGTLKTLFAVAEQYPDLKASTNFAQLQDELSDTENKIQAARRFYNGQVRDFNTAIQVFPTSLFASMFQMKSFDFFGLANETERENVKVQF